MHKNYKMSNSKNIRDKDDASHLPTLGENGGHKECMSRMFYIRNELSWKIEIRNDEIRPTLDMKTT